jgi:uncharacterized protein (TIGR02246 family)
MKALWKAGIVAIALAVLIAISFASQQKSVPSGDEIQIQQLERAWNQAEARHDTKALTALVADTLSYIDFDGSLQDKAGYLKDVTQTTYQADHLYDEGLTVRVYGNAAVATGVYRETGTSKGKQYVHRARFTDTWVKQDGVWRCAASQSTLILK